VIVRRTGKGWLISRYQVSRLAQPDATTPVTDRAAGGD
jgi:hypothetical protein